MTNNTEIKANIIKEESFTAAEVATMIEEGKVRENYLRLEKGFEGLYEFLPPTAVKINSFKTGKEIEMPVWHLRNDSTSKSVWMSTMMSAKVVDSDVDIKTKEIEDAKGLKVYFSDDFYEDHPGIKSLSDYRNEDGSMNTYDKYKIIGAIVTRSKVDEERWSLSYKMYEQGALFLALAKQLLGEAGDKLKYIREERVLELASMPKDERVVKIAGRDPIQLPSKSQLKIVGDAEKNVSKANCTFLLRKIWE